MADTKTLIEQPYSAFNKRDIDSATSLEDQERAANHILSATGSLPMTQAILVDAWQPMLLDQGGSEISDVSERL